MKFDDFAKLCGVTIPMTIVARIAPIAKTGGTHYHANNIRKLYTEGQYGRVYDILVNAEKKFQSICKPKIDTSALLVKYQQEVYEKNKGKYSFGDGSQCSEIYNELEKAYWYSLAEEIYLFGKFDRVLPVENMV